jgi:uncharacterized protein (TIGR03643 family)
MSVAKKYQLSEQDIERIIEMAWEDRTPFEAIESQFSISEKEVIALMREEMRASSWRMWRERMNGRKTKHKQKPSEEVERFRCKLQKAISLNKISKR